MNATVLSLVLATVLAPPATTSPERSTRIYVRTTPPGASIVLDSKELGTSDGLFLVPPGVRTITLEMDGYDPELKSVNVKEGWITRVEVRMARTGEKPDKAAAVPEPRVLHFVRWVIQDDDTMTFEGTPVKLDELASLLEKVPGRAETVLEVGYSSQISVKLRNECIARAVGFAQKLGFTYASDIGEQKLGSKGSPPQEVAVSEGGYDGRDIRVSQVEQELLEAKRKLAEELKHYGEQHPRIQSLKARIHAAEKYLERPAIWSSMLRRKSASVEASAAQRESTLSEDAPVRTIHLPDADTKDTPVVLDLASGEMLRLPWREPEGDATYFTKLGKGDLGFDSMLFCLRGGKVELWQDGSAEHLDVNGMKDDAKIYQLPKLPCELLVTTPENRQYLVKVLNEAANGGLDLEYREHSGATGNSRASSPDFKTPAFNNLDSDARTDATPIGDGVLEFRVAADEQDAKAFAETGEGLKWYKSLMREANGLVTRKQGEQSEILLWETPEKSMTAGDSAEKKWRVIEVSIIAEPGKPGRIGVVFDQEGGRLLKKLTAANVNRHMAMLVDGQVVSCPMIRAAIGPRVEISGNFSREELTRLATALQAGMETTRPEMPATY
jgi:hypothetical protein